MVKIKRNIIIINAEKCNGCGLCVHGCAEGAIHIINGKAKLLSEMYCDGLGACIGKCPQEAITIEQRDALPFNEEAVKRHSEAYPSHAHSCPGAAAAQLSLLKNWPVQLALVPTSAPYLADAELLFSADCAPFACESFHNHFMNGKVVLTACPKLDNVSHYVEKLTLLFSVNDIKSINIVFMEVPCCSGLVRMVVQALTKCEKDIPIKLIKLGLNGDILETY